MLAYFRRIGRTYSPWLGLWAVLALALALNFAPIPQLEAASHAGAAAATAANGGHMTCCDECDDMVAMGCAKAVPCATVCAPLPQRAESAAGPYLRQLATVRLLQEDGPRSHPPDPLRRPPRLA